MIGLAVGSACVGDDPAPVTVAEHPQGERGGSCFPNMTCNGGGLACIDGFCLLPGDPVPVADGGTDGASGEGSIAVDAGGEGGSGGEAGLDGATSPCGPPPRHDAGVLQCNTQNNAPCINIGANGQTCCGTPGTCTSPGTCADTAGLMACESSADCFDPNQPECCLFDNGFIGAAGTCPMPITIPTYAKCVVGGTCVGMKGAQLCTVGDVCPGGQTCKAVALDIGVAGQRKRTITVGICSLP